MFHWFYPSLALIVAAVLALLPYLIVRGLVNRSHAAGTVALENCADEFRPHGGNRPGTEDDADGRPTCTERTGT